MSLRLSDRAAVAYLPPASPNDPIPSRKIPAGVCTHCGATCFAHAVGRDCRRCEAGTFVHHAYAEWMWCPTCVGRWPWCRTCQCGIVLRAHAPWLGLEIVPWDETGRPER